MSFVPKLVILFVVIWSLLVSPTLSDISLNHYGDPAYPGRCVLDVGSTVVLLGMGQGYRLQNLPCVNIFCIGDGYGMLYTCEKATPPDGCRFAELIDWDAMYPECCKREVVCD